MRSRRLSPPGGAAQSDQVRADVLIDSDKAQLATGCRIGIDVVVAARRAIQADIVTDQAPGTWSCLEVQTVAVITVDDQGLVACRRGEAPVVRVGEMEEIGRGQRGDIVAVPMTVDPFLIMIFAPASAVPLSVGVVFLVMLSVDDKSLSELALK
jgi:hypothetical protein